MKKKVESLEHSPKQSKSPNATYEGKFDKDGSFRKTTSDKDNKSRANSDNQETTRTKA